MSQLDQPPINFQNQSSPSSLKCVNRFYKNVMNSVLNDVKEIFIVENIELRILEDFRQKWEERLKATRFVQQAQFSNKNKSVEIPSKLKSDPIACQLKKLPSRCVALVPVEIAPAERLKVPLESVTIHIPYDALESGIAGPHITTLIKKTSTREIFLLEASEAAETIQRIINTELEKDGVILPPSLLQYNFQVKKQSDEKNLSENLQFVDSKELIANMPLIGDLQLPILDTACKTENIICTDLLGKAQLDGASDKLPVHLFDDIGKWSRIYESDDSDNNLFIASIPTYILDSFLEKKGLLKSQVDGLYDSSDEIMSDEDDDDDDDDDDGEDKICCSNEENDTGSLDNELIKNPLNSDDDVSDEDVVDNFETSDVIVCQYEQISRKKNKWKFRLKDGIMHLKGKDYIFNKADGVGSWC